MGKLLSGINGPVTGRVGNLIFTTWNGTPVVKSRPVRKAPATENEKAVRNFFGYTQRWLRPIAPFLDAGLIGTPGFDPGRTGRNIATSLMFKHAVIRDGDNASIEPSLMPISLGSLPLAEDFQLHFDQDKLEVKVSWTPNVPAHVQGCTLASCNDQLMLLIYNPEEALVLGKVHGVLREQGEQRCIIPKDPEVEYHIWVAFIGEDRKSRSESLYLGTVRP